MIAYSRTELNESMQETKIQCLKDEATYPSKEVLKAALKRAYPAFEGFIETVEAEPFELTHSWKYYKDGKSWLCKVSHKKKTMCWISIWEGFFKIGYYFTERFSEGIMELDIDDALKSAFTSAQPIGKLKPLPIDVSKKSQLTDVYALLDYKKRAK